MQTRKDFVGGLVSAFALGSLPTLAAESPEDWKEAFARLGFDPSAPGSSTFVIATDVHYPRLNEAFSTKAIPAIQAMSPRPRRLVFLGDNINVTQYFGHIANSKSDHDRAEKAAGLLKADLKKLDPSIEIVFTIGNHDTKAGEVDAASFREFFPETKPYEIFRQDGVVFLKLNGSQDGDFDLRQRAWISQVAKTIRDDEPLAILIHQPGEIIRERGCWRILRTDFANRKGETWVLAGHKHGNRAWRWTLPGGGEVAFQVHGWGQAGYWIYGLRGGRIAARVFCPIAEGLKPEPFGLPSVAMPLKGEVPYPYKGLDVVWQTWVGDPEELSCRVAVEKTCVPGSWFAYTGKLVYRFLKAKVAPASRTFALAGEQMMRKLGDPKKADLPDVPYFFSLDGKDWARVPTPKAKNDIMVFPLKDEWAKAETLWFRVDGYQMASGDVGGFAFLNGGI